MADEANMRAYEGTQPYIFVSYSHRDSAKAMLIIDKLQEAGFRVWYDRGIEVGTEWPKYLATQLTNCQCVLVLLSRQWQASKNCRREFVFADEKDKDILVVNIEEFDVGDDLKMQMGLYQQVFMYRSSEERFFEELFSAKLLAPCRSEDEQLNEQRMKTQSAPLQKEKTSSLNRKQKITIITTMITITAILLVIVLIFISNRNNHPSDLIDITENVKPGQTVSFSDFEALEADQVFEGDTISFGTYEQDNEKYDGPEPIEWLVLGKDDKKLLLLSKYILDCQPYNTTLSDVCWEDCTLREWLNNEFYNIAFSDAEKEHILTSTTQAHSNPGYPDVKQGNDVVDLVFVMSAQEAIDYFPADQTRMARPTEYVVSRGAIVDESTECVWWWLRTVGNAPKFGCAVNSYGEISLDGYSVYREHDCVRPMIWIELEH